MTCGEGPLDCPDLQDPKTLNALAREYKEEADALADALRDTLRWLKHAKSVSLFCGCRFRHWGDCGTRRLEREIETWDAALANCAPKKEEA